MMLSCAKMKYFLTIVFPQHVSGVRNSEAEAASQGGAVPLQGRDAMVEGFLDFLIGHFTFLGFDFQYWMPVFMGAVAIYLLYLWRTGQW
jgi:hypothetical protein